MVGQFSYQIFHPEPKQYCICPAIQTPLPEPFFRYWYLHYPSRNSINTTCIMTFLQIFSYLYWSFTKSIHLCLLTATAVKRSEWLEWKEQTETLFSLELAVPIVFYCSLWQHNLLFPIITRLSSFLVPELNTTIVLVLSRHWLPIVICLFRRPVVALGALALKQYAISFT